MKTSFNSFFRKSSTACLAWLCASSIAAYAGQRQEEAKAVEPPPTDPWKFDLAIPGWLAATSGTIGVDGINSDIYMSAETLIKNLDMIATLSGEARKGRFGIYGDLLYVSASDGVGQNGLIGKVDVALEQWLVDLELNYRVLEGPRGFLDVRAGVRYTNIYNELTISPNDSEIEKASNALVDDIGREVNKRLKEIDLRGSLRTALENRVNNQVVSRLAGVDANRKSLAVAPLGARKPDRVRDIVKAAIDRRLDELAAAIRAQDQAATEALRADARRKVDAVKRRISKEVASKLERELDNSFSLTEDWWDPYVGIRARLNLSTAWYLTGKADIGGFGVGSQITWQGYAALGCQITRNIYAEAGYRYLYTDYDHNNFVYKVTQSGAEITLGVVF